MFCSRDAPARAVSRSSLLGSTGGGAVQVLIQIQAEKSNQDLAPPPEPDVIGGFGN
jgi:hypothetical protein